MELVWFKGVSCIKKSLKEMSKLWFLKAYSFKGVFSISSRNRQQKLQKRACYAKVPSTEKFSSKFLHSKGIAKLMHGLLEQVSKVIPKTLSPESKRIQADIKRDA